MTKEQATARAKRLKAKMTTKGWKIRVSDNIGWHYSIHNGYITVYESRPGTYHALMGDVKDGFGGLAVWTPIVNYGKNPNEVVVRTLNAAKKYVEGLYSVVDEQFKLLGLMGLKNN